MHGYFVASFPYFNRTGSWAPDSLSVDLRIQTYTDMYGTGSVKIWKLATRYPWIYGYYCSALYDHGQVDHTITSAMPH